MLGRSVTYCSKLTTDEAREVAEAVSGLDPRARVAGFRPGVSTWLKVSAQLMESTTIWFEPYFPHGQITFSGPFG